MSLFTTEHVGFYLQDAFVKDWIDNTMVFIEVDNVNNYYAKLEALNLTEKYKEVRLTPIKVEHWEGSAFCMTHQVFFCTSGNFSISKRVRAIFNRFNFERKAVKQRFLIKQSTLNGQKIYICLWINTPSIVRNIKALRISTPNWYLLWKPKPIHRLLNHILKRNLKR